MKQKILLFLLTCFVGLCAYLFIVFYGEAEKTAIRQLNEEQQIHAKQAAHGIEDFFATWTGILSSFSKMDAIIGDDADGKRYMTLFYEAHHEQIRSITRVDERGRILHTVPFSSSIGSDISDQKHMQAILEEPCARCERCIQNRPGVLGDRASYARVQGKDVQGYDRRRS